MTEKNFVIGKKVEQMVLFDYAMNYHCDVLGFFTPLQTKNRKSLPKNPSLFLICPQFSAKNPA